jgi:hypothetical protein
MATTGREPESAEQDATTLRDETEITLGDDVAVVHADGIEIVVDDRTEPVDTVPPDAPRSRWQSFARPVVVIVAALLTLVVIALGAAALRDDGDAEVATEPSAPTGETFAPPTVDSTPGSTVATTAPATTAPPRVVAPVDPPATQPPVTPPPATQPPATQPTSPPATHSPTDYTGLTRTLSTTSLSAAPGTSASFTLTYVNTSSWTMRVMMPPCAYVVGEQVCVAGGVLEDLAPGATAKRSLSVKAPVAPGAYEVRVTNVANGDLKLSLQVG